jgi:L-alanine-DL-glutamate epimerase-like enolase superfamily enzyme
MLESSRNWQHSEERRINVEKVALGFKEAADASNTSHWTWRRLADQGLVRTINLGARRLIPRDEFERVMREGAGKHRSGKGGSCI